MTKRSQNVSQREEMMLSEERATVTIFSSLEYIEQKGEIFFLLKGNSLTIDAFSISEGLYTLYFADGTTKQIPTPKGYCKSIINNIISDLKNGRIQSEKEYDFRKFDEKYLESLKGLLNGEVTSSSQGLTDINSRSTTSGIVNTVSNITTELFDSSQSAEPTTEKVEYEIQEDSEYVAVEPDYLEEQEFYFSSNETSEELSYMMEEIRRSNDSNGITSENIEYVKNMTNVFHLGNKPEGIPERPIFNGTNVEGPKLPEIPGPRQYAGALAAGIAGGVFCMVVAVVGLGYWLWNRKSRENGYDVERARGVEKSPEGSSLLSGSSEAYTTNGVEEPNSLLDVNEVIGSEVGYHSFKRNVSYNNIL
ncbi:hypothetical protein [Candidatus Wolbachia massiliensis]|uniref:Uncharacterized protein n=1 Tax=Candidatus Wolbachia massiliensis TaxID=1845000 RepID=A0A7L7YLZ7_9RICK|nr:hypothetical protein [Candidatus Wolbachia massiliensis]QOD38272.1 hypothetical protein ID128_05875 [Candidatus Wolbachia massiliensis]